ncbi:FHA domain-containing protein [Ottowia caeni]|uniref:FHA domain-containing protein n=1 Tax=Ottowia caeni TaxID=2870339 RepID=UPI001E4F7E63|nr:FHA domain-containing protein [Ottowia caeni]
MPKLIVSIDGVVVKEVPLTKSRLTLGRRPYNDLVLDHLAVSGEHAMILLEEGGRALLEDRGSTNGTYLNGQFIKRQALKTGDIIEIGKCRLRYLDDAASAAEPPVHTAPRVRVLSGSATGRELPLTKAVTTIGKAGVSVACITHRPTGFELAHVEGPEVSTVNGVSLAVGPIYLKNRDQIAIGGVRLEFIEH